MVKDYQTLLDDYGRKLQKAIKHLEYSHKKIQNLPEEPEKMDDEILETWESFAARFGRVVDLFMTKYIKAAVLKDDPGFSGTFRDSVNQAEKLNLIDNAMYWMGLRELRNISVHEYTEEDLAHFFKKIKLETPQVLKIKSLLK